ncbi:MAG TPA: glycosyltransferase, partial [Planctomycetaceae bacterium]
MILEVSVVIPTCRRPEMLARCLEALARQTLPADRYEVIIVDDARDPQTMQAVVHAAAHAKCRFQYTAVPGPTHGPAAARNLGWRAARAPIVAFTDDDCVPEPGWLEAGVATIEHGVEAAAGAIVMPLPPRPTDYERDASGLTKGEFVTANCFCQRWVLERVGGFDENFTAAWREDSDLQFSLLERGLQIA